MAKKLANTTYSTEQCNSEQRNSEQQGTEQQLLKKLNRRAKVPIAEFIREGIDLVLEKYRNHLPGQMELGSILPGAADPRVRGSSNGKR
jgi:hypothetical protein